MGLAKILYFDRESFGILPSICYSSDVFFVYATIITLLITEDPPEGHNMEKEVINQSVVEKQAASSTSNLGIKSLPMSSLRSMSTNFT